MFLACTSTSPHIIEYILSFIEENSVLMGVITSVIISSLWFKKFINQKRAEAFFGFYAKLSLRLKSLQITLQENGQLNITNPEIGNIYSLIYSENFVIKACPGYKKPNDNELKSYKTIAKELKNLLLNTENNVYPPGANRKEWYKNQHILFLFCEFIENEIYQHRTNEEFDKGENEPKHIKKCKALIDAINNIQRSIDNAKY